MESTQLMKTENGSEWPVDTLDGSTKSKLVAATESDGSSNSSTNTTATMQTDSKKTWTNVELAELVSKAGLVAGALSDFQTAGGLVVVKNVEYEKDKFSVKIYLVAENLNIRVQKTADGLDFDIQPLGSGCVEQGKK